MFFDSHAHLTLKQIDTIEETLIRAKEKKVKKIINICIDVIGLKRGLELSKKHPWIYNAAATTPHDVGKLGERDFAYFKKAAKDKQLIAIGETGLDYYYMHSEKELQKKFLIQYVHLALQCKLPVIFHCREAFSDLFSITDLEYPSSAAILHCFTGTKEEAKKALDRGWCISFSGIVTFKKSEELRQIVKYVPLDRLLIETDTPYLAPQSKRGQENEPSFIIETAKILADIKDLSLEEISKITYQNSCKIFQLFEEK